MSSDNWTVAAGDPTYVFVPGASKPINCGSKQRAKLVAVAPQMLALLERVASGHEITMSEALEVVKKAR